MKRRTLVTTGVAGAAGLVAAEQLAEQYDLVPPDGSGIYGPGTTLTYAAHRLLTRNALAREFPRSEISRPPHQNGKPPKEEAYVKHVEAGFADWRVQVDGMVARPTTLSVADLRRYPSRSQITHLACEEGWSYIAEWTGAPLSEVLNLVGARTGAKFVVFHTIQNGWWGSIDIDEARHPQTLLAYGMNGGELPPGHGGPLRLRVPRQLGYRSLKYVNRITVTDRAPEGRSEYSWYAGI
ncbi:MAG: molybdopterin-dependent oxidoreductase [Bryobacteraceae bacterium]|nr:molybdopterin-dependent oxidoreductase [Bryobacteraceae bacterium]